MADTDDTTKAGPSSNVNEGVSAESAPAGGSDVDSDPASDAASNFRPTACNAWEEAVEAERAQLLQARSVLVCLYEVLLHADGEDAVTYAEAAHVAAHLIDDSVERLDLVKLRPLIGRAQVGKVRR